MIHEEPARELESDNELVEELEYKNGDDVPIARDSESDTEVTISVTCRISSNTNATILILHDFTILEVEELEYKEGDDDSLARDLASDCYVTISVTLSYFV